MGRLIQALLEHFHAGRLPHVTVDKCQQTLKREKPNTTDMTELDKQEKNKA